jgi:hypothetical protein
MTESKIELTERLRREGRWAEASQFRDTARGDFHAKGMKRDEASEAAWAAMAQAYPPLPAAEVPTDAADGVEDTPAPTSPEAASAPLPSPRAVRMPPEWASLPGNASPKAEVEWVAANLALCRGRRTGGPDTMDLAQAASPAPSLASIGMLEAAISNPNKFMLEVYTKFVGANEPDPNEKEKEEEMAIEEVKAILASLRKNRDEKLRAERKNADEELRADVPGVLQQRVWDMLSNWVQHSGVSLPDDARACLDSAIVGLLRDSLRAVAPSSGAK